MNQQDLLLLVERQQIELSLLKPSESIIESQHCSISQLLFDRNELRALKLRLKNQVVDQRYSHQEFRRLELELDSTKREVHRLHQNRVDKVKDEFLIRQLREALQNLQNELQQLHSDIGNERKKQLAQKSTNRQLRKEKNLMSKNLALESNSVKKLEALNSVLVAELSRVTMHASACEKKSATHIHQLKVQNQKLETKVALLNSKLACLQDVYGQAAAIKVCSDLKTSVITERDSEIKQLRAANAKLLCKNEELQRNLDKAKQEDYEQTKELVELYSKYDESLKKSRT